MNQNSIISYTKAQRYQADLLLFLCVFVIDAMSIPLSQNIKVALSTVLCGFIVLKDVANGKLFKDNYKTKWVLMPCLLLIIPQLLYSDFVLSYESKILQIWAGYILFKKVPKELFTQKYIKLLYYICIISIPIWFSTVMGLNLWAWAPSSGDGQYKTLFLYCVDTYGDNGRNNGPFWEPGVFQMYINIAVLFLLYSKKNINIKYLLVFVIALATTYSTTGYICFALVLITYYYDKSDSIKGCQFFLSMLGAVGVYVFFTTNLELYDRVFGKFDSTSVANASMVIRVNEIIFYYELWKSNLGYMLLGAGATNAYNFVMGQHFIADVFFEGSTQTTLRELASFGVVFTFIRLCLFYRFSKIFCKKILARAIVVLIVIIMINTESMIYSMLFNCLWYLGANDIDNKILPDNI